MRTPKDVGGMRCHLSRKKPDAPVRRYGREGRLVVPPQFVHGATVNLLEPCNGGDTGGLSRCVIALPRTREGLHHQVDGCAHIIRNLLGIEITGNYSAPSKYWADYTYMNRVFPPPSALDRHRCGMLVKTPVGQYKPN